MLTGRRDNQQPDREIGNCINRYQKQVVKQTKQKVIWTNSRYTEKQIDTQADRQGGRTDREREAELRGSEVDKQTERETDRQTSRQTN